MAQADEAARLMTTTRARWDAVRAVGESLRDLQATIARSAYVPICAAANTLTARASLPLAVEIRSEADFGAVKPDGVYVPFWALSDSERAVVGVALAVAFARLSGAKWRVAIVDRLEALDADRLPRVLAALAALVTDGWIDNFLGAYVGRLPAIDGVTEHRLSERSV
jgi:hypothetical protein